MLCFGSVSLLVSALLLILSALVKRPDPRLHLCDRPRKVGQLTSDKGYVLLDCHPAQNSIAAGAKSAERIMLAAAEAASLRRRLGNDPCDTDDGLRVQDDEVEPDNAPDRGLARV